VGKKKTSKNKATVKSKKISLIPLNVLFAFALFTASVSLLYQERTKTNLNVLGQQTTIKKDQETVYQWEQIVQERPECRDCWLQLSAAYLKIGENIKARQALNSAKQIDPNNEHIPSLEKFLEN
jgi:cytochrome c-type biogenesis protein CcmH/NrfG